jgi:hypothetical protein
MVSKVNTTIFFVLYKYCHFVCPLSFNCYSKLRAVERRLSIHVHTLSITVCLVTETEQFISSFNIKV